MIQFYVGADMSKHYFDVSYISQGRPIYLGRFDNSDPGYKICIKQLGVVAGISPEQWFICFENTGVYSKGFLYWLLSKHIPCREECALKICKSLGIRRGKNDEIDSKDIARYCFEKRDTIQRSELTSPTIKNLKRLLSRRDFLVKRKVSFKNSLVDQKSVTDELIYEMFELDNKKIIAELNTQIKKLNKVIEQLILSDESTKKNYELAKSVKGIGPVISAYMVAFTENFTCFENARKFACFSGVAPFPNQSGTKIGKTQVSHMANKKIKSLLSNGVNAAIMYDKEIGMYYQRKIAEGKEKGVVFNAIKNKLIQRVFAVIKRQSPYVCLHNYA